MIIACPACATRYVVPDSAIGAEGRTVRCAKCRHSWFQDGPALDVPDRPADDLEQSASAPDPVSPPPSEARRGAEAMDRAPAAPPRREPSSSPLADPAAEPAQESEPAPVIVSAPEEASDYAAPTGEEQFEAPPAVVETAPAPAPESDDYGQEISQFDYAPPFKPRRNMLKIWTAAAALFAVLAIGTVAAVSYWGLPDWVPVSRPTFALGQPDLVLDFPRNQQERRTLPNGTEYFGASGSIKNVGRESRSVPSILIVLRDARERIVYSWEIAPPKANLAPGETVTINEAVTDVPRSAKFAEIGWKPA